MSTLVNEEISDSSSEPDDLSEGADDKSNKINSPDNPYYPWPSKEHFIMALLFNSACLLFSDAQKQAVLNWAKELGAKDVPLLYAVKKCQECMESAFGVPMHMFESQTGNIFYLNDVVKAVAMDYSNPLTHFEMQDYPEDGGLGMSEVFHGEKMLLELPSPPAGWVHGKIFFVGFIVSDMKEIVCISGFMHTFEDLSADPNELSCGLVETSSQLAKLVPHPLHAKANGHMVYSVPLIIFMDDVSGNISKQWNKHHAIYMSNANLPHAMIEKEFCVSNEGVNKVCHLFSF
ncbi:hypothetical protein SCLCIDRAFT_26728 [Scleroderma citrinum Foug A]|uniref:Uncharacterized protein n=1 Tax=Scleroderma citrinum Foug A TaxID=1036808 RepID=A0A0C3DVI8_9AGAM|nr:hypothetical protein SCLCIDRAFT_26728 [Scleroderma citrinum Foug A]